jgi:methionyl-tRNA formyltransferase
MRVAFAGTPEFAAAALGALHEAGFQVPLVLTQPDRPAGRGMKVQPSPVKAFALRHGMPVIQPRSLRHDGRHPGDAAQAEAALQGARPDVMVVAAYGLILPAWALELPRLGCINIHASLLPRWRGAAPIQRALEAGDAGTGITIMQMDAGLDTGPMLMVERLAIAPDDTSATLQARLAGLGARLVVEALEAAACGGLVPVPQPAEGATYAAKINKSEAPIDWMDAAEVIERRIRAFDPFPGATFEYGGEVVKLWKAAVAPAIDARPGTFLDEGGRLRVACGHAALELLTVQRPGGRRLPVTEFLRSGGR